MILYEILTKEGVLMPGNCDFDLGSAANKELKIGVVVFLRSFEWLMLLVVPLAWQVEEEDMEASSRCCW